MMRNFALMLICWNSIPSLTMTLNTYMQSQEMDAITKGFNKHNDEIHPKGKKMPKVELKEFIPAHYQESLQPVHYFYAHGIAESYKQAYWYSKTTPRGTVHSPYLCDGRLFSFNFHDATEKFWRMNFMYTSLAQSNEIEVLRNAFEQAKIKLAEQCSFQDFVLMGMSRGATTILNFMSIYKPENVKAIIVESPFDSTHTIIKHILRKLNLHTFPSLHSFAHTLMKVAFWKHSTKGIHAIDVVENICHDVPILFIASHQDILVPAHSTIALYEKIKNAGHPKVHLYIDDLGPHGMFLKHKNGVTYQNVVHAFYKTYGLPHDSTLAQIGQVDFDRCNF